MFGLLQSEDFHLLLSKIRFKNNFLIQHCCHESKITKMFEMQICLNLSSFCCKKLPKIYQIFSCTPTENVWVVPILRFSVIIELATS